MPHNEPDLTDNELRMQDAFRPVWGEGSEGEDFEEEISQANGFGGVAE